MGRLNQSQGFLFSAIVHLAILMTLGSKPPAPRACPRHCRGGLTAPSPGGPDRPRPGAAAAVPAAATGCPEAGSDADPAPGAGPKDRISIGPPSDVRQKQLILRRDEDLVMPKGTPDAAPSVEPAESPAARRTP